jgi:uncharacterized repeat protein (TIGR03803 family)
MKELCSYLQVSLIFCVRACMLPLILAATAPASLAQVFTTVASLDSSNAHPQQMSFVQGLDGNLYGTSGSGGSEFGGAVFKVSSDGTLTTLYTFCPEGDCSTGHYPYGALAQAPDGSFYGTTYEGGASGYGEVYRITPAGDLTTIYSFPGTYPFGDNPTAGLVLASDGNFYGTTFYTNNVGTVFRVTPGGTHTTIYTFCAQYSCSDGRYPEAPLIQAADGSFYGTTAYGGNSECSGGLGCGTIFRITSAGTLTSLYSFCAQPGCTDGQLPEAGLVWAVDGNFYGTTTLGGTYSSDCYLGSCGTVFRITPSGALTTLYTFCTQPGCADGASPLAGLFQGTGRNLYGTTSDGGADGDGTIFMITAAGAMTVLHNFDSTDGEYPSGGLVQSTSGEYYGASDGGGVNGDGTVFSLSSGLDPFVEALPNFAKAGATVDILGQGFTGTTAVSFNGVPAEFSVTSGTSLRATVPTGATTGKITVTTPSRTLLSNVVFHVRP